MDGTDLTSITPTLCALLGIRPPQQATAPPHAEVLAAQSDVLGGQAVEKLLIFAPDALGRWLTRAHFDRGWQHVQHFAPVRVELKSMLPTVTPVCFSSIFTGAQPAVHGIQKYERPLQRTDSFFDALVRAGRSCALVAVRDCSMDIIFRERAIDYFSEEDDAGVLERALTLIREDAHDVVLAYQQGYDDWLHQTTPESPECLAALDFHLHSFSQLAFAAHSVWGGGARSWACCFISDHGSHIDPATGLGTHGSERPEDMELTHWWGVHAAG